MKWDYFAKGNFFMFRLRFDCPFGGYGDKLFGIGLVLVMISVFMTVINDGDIILAVIIPALTVIMGGYIWANRLTPLDRKNMDKAELPLWRPLTDDEREKLLKKKKFSILSYVVGLSVPLGLMLPPRGSSSNNVPLEERTTTKLAIAVAIVIGILMIIGYINSLRWKTVDDTAVCTVVPVHLHFSVEHHSRRSSWTSEHIVIYLPDAKYVLRSTLAGSQTVKIVRYGGMLAYFEDDADDELLMWND